jgi:hypothetical protein
VGEDVAVKLQTAMEKQGVDIPVAALVSVNKFLYCTIPKLEYNLLVIS